MKQCLCYTVAIVLLGCVGFSLVLFGQGLPMQHSDSSNQRVVATVGSTSITVREAERNVALPLYQLDQQRSQLLLYSVQQLIDAELLRLEAERTGQTIDQLLAPACSTDSSKAPVVSNSDALLDKTSAHSRRRQAVLLSLRRQSPIQLNLPQIAEPIVDASSDDDPSIGPSTAPVTIVEFSDFQCPFSKRSAGVLKQVREAYGQNVRVVYRDYPAPNHVYAGKAAEAAQCAAVQGKFWVYHDLLFEQQQPGSPWDLIQLARQAGMDLSEFSRCIDTRQYAEEVEHDLRDALRHGITSTPTFFINGHPLVGTRSFDDFRTVIDRALAEHKQSFPSS